MIDYDIDIEIVIKRSYRIEAANINDAQVTAIKKAVAEYPNTDIFLTGPRCRIRIEEDH